MMIFALVLGPLSGTVSSEELPFFLRQEPFHDGPSDPSPHPLIGDVPIDTDKCGLRPLPTVGFFVNYSRARLLYIFLSTRSAKLHAVQPDEGKGSPGPRERFLQYAECVL